MKTLKTLLIVILILIAIPLLTALFVPKTYHISTGIIVHQNSDSVYAYLTQLKNQNEFGPWAALDPDIKNSYRGTDGTIGFVARWESNHPQVGTGEQEITGLITNRRIDTELRFEKPYTGQVAAYFTTTPKDSVNTYVVWGCEGSLPYPKNILLLTRFEDEMRAQFDEGLQNLKNQLE